MPYNFSKKLVTVAFVCFLVWIVMTLWHSATKPDMPKAIGNGGACIMPEAVSPEQPPKITLIQYPMPDFKLSGATLKPLAGFSAFGKVRIKAEPKVGNIRKISLTNVLLGWKEVAPNYLVEAIEAPQTITTTSKDCQGKMRVSNQVVTQDANNVNLAQVFFIPSSQEVTEAISKIKKSDNIHIDGWIVDVNTLDGDEWQNSTNKNSYYFVYTCRVTVSQ